MGREKTDQMNAEVGTPDSTATMIKRSLKYGIKQAFSGGMADKARKAIEKNKQDTQKQIDKDTQ